MKNTSNFSDSSLFRRKSESFHSAARFGGFSLVELMVVIAVIGIIAAMAVPNLASVSSQARYAKSQRNAQTIASMAATARAAGYTNDWETVENAIGLLTTNSGKGLVVGENFSFGVSSLSEGEVMDATEFLRISGGSSPDTLVYSNSN
jgi:prepilin-type N-terminal cleavage/methylation domain-containing protein